MTKEIAVYKDRRGRKPFSEWLFGLRDSVGRARIVVRLDRVESGNIGDHRSVGGGVFELRMAFGAGYRMYYGMDGDRVVVLLAGGDKSTQSKDITAAKLYWEDYNERKSSEVWKHG